MKNLLLCYSAMLISLFSLSDLNAQFVPALTILGYNFTVDPSDQKQEVTFGGDGKLTIVPWAQGNVNISSNQLFGAMELEILRVPIFALHPITHPIYNDVITVIKAVKTVNPNVKIFASVANGDGYGSNFHGASKFPPYMKGCCPGNLYSLDLTAYAAYLDSFMDRMSLAGITVDYLGPWNEDSADDSDYNQLFSQMTKLGNTETVGLERWALNTSIANVDDVEDRVDIIGSHFFDDVSIPEQNWESRWKKLVDKSADPVWFTEATRTDANDHIDGLVNGMNHIFPSMNAGVEAVIFYQVLPRFVRPSGTTKPIRYTGFKALVNASKNKKIIESFSNNPDIKGVAFSGNNRLEVFMVNTSLQTKLGKIKIDAGYSALGAVTTTIWDATNTAQSSNSLAFLKTNIPVALPAWSFVWVSIPVRKKLNGKFEELSDNFIGFEENIQVYPNPVTDGIINISRPSSESELPIAVELYSLDGKKIFKTLKSFDEELELNVEKDIKGVYLLKVTHGEFKLEQKIVFN